MATKKTSTKAKGGKAKNSKKATAKKSSAAKISASSKVQKTSNDQLRQLNLASGLVALLLAVAAGFLMNATSYQLFTSLMTSNELASANGTVFVPGIHFVMDVELRWLVVGILVLSAVLPLLAATRNRKMYEDSVAKKVMPLRWIELGVISALMVELIAILSGVQDVMTLKLIAGFMLVTALLSWFSEKQTGKAMRHYNLSLVTGILPWLVIAVAAAGTLIYGSVRSPWYVYALYFTTLLAITGYAMNGKRLLQGQQSYKTSERNNIQLGIFAKVTFALILIVGLLK